MPHPCQRGPLNGIVPLRGIFAYPLVAFLFPDQVIFRPITL